jgi:hypothetical protein
MKIPIISTPDKPIVATTQNFIPIADITDGLALFKDGGAALVLESTSLNFGLLSAREQRAVIAGYAGLLNSFNFSVQILVRSQKKDISNYMRYLEEAEKRVKIPKLKAIMQDYEKFIVEAIKKKNVLSKNFYLVIPFTPYELGIAKSLKSSFLPTKADEPLPFPKSYVLRKAKVALFPKRDHLIRQAGRLSIELTQLDNAGLVKLYYNVFNPESPAKEDLEKIIGG